MRINKDVSKFALGCFVILTGILAFTLYQAVMKYNAFIFDHTNWLMLSVLFQNIIYIFEPRVGFENEEAKKNFMNKSDSNAFSLVWILLFIGWIVFDYSADLKNIVVLDNLMIGTYLLILATGIIFFRMLVYLISCLLYKGE